MISWREDFILPLESPWSILQKLAWFNESTSTRLLSELWELQGPLAEGRGDLNQPTCFWNATWEGAAESEPLLEGRSLLSVLADRWTSDWILGASRPAETLRFCVDCIRVGYHGVLHQVPHFERCVIHDVPLVQGCPICGKTVVYALAPTRAAYGCDKCNGFMAIGENWAPQATDWVRQRWQEVELSGGSWFLEMQRLHFRSGCVSIPARKDGWECLVRPEAILGWMAHRLQPLPWVESVLGPEPEGCQPHLYESRFGELILATGTCSPSEWAKSEIELRETIDEIAGSFLVEHAHCHPCLVNVHQALRINRSYVTPFVIAPGAICVVALGYYLWFNEVRRILTDLRSRARREGRPKLVYSLPDVRRALRSELFARIAAVHAEVSGHENSVVGKRSIWAINGLEGRFWLDDSIQDVPAPSTSVRVDVDLSALVRTRICTGHGAIPQ